MPYPQGLLVSQGLTATQSDGDGLLSQWWFWLIVALVVLSGLVVLSFMLWTWVFVIGFSTWRRALVSTPVALGLVYLLVKNFDPILDWVNAHWPLTAIPVIFVGGAPFILIFAALTSGGGSSTAAGSNPRCPRCGQVGFCRCYTGHE